MYEPTRSEWERSPEPAYGEGGSNSTDLKCVFSKRVCGDGVGRSEILKDGRLFDFWGEGYIQTNSGNELIADSMADIEVFSKAEFQKIIDETKSSLISLVIDYEATDCFIRNCVYPDVLPDSDEERASFGYALFWIAKRNLAITLLFGSNEIVKSVCTGKIQSCADAIRGLFEHPTLSDGYQSAVEEILKRLIFEMRIISFSVTDDEVNCKFVPSFLTEETISENKNENQYWRIKMLNILQQIYPIDGSELKNV